MSDKASLSDYLVLSRGQWDPDLSPEVIQNAIDQFYDWYAAHLEAGTMKPGSRLMREAKLVSRERIIDGPFSEAKEIIGGYWFIVAESLEAAAQIAAANPCIACGLALEIRQLEPERASAYMVTNETPR